jgi:hypothetical protein
MKRSIIFAQDSNSGAPEEQPSYSGVPYTVGPQQLREKLRKQEERA